jgi:hypothetical protein
MNVQKYGPHTKMDKKCTGNLKADYLRERKNIRSHEVRHVAQGRI